MAWRQDDNPRTEYEKVRYLTVPYTRGAGLAVGCEKAPFPNFTCADDTSGFEDASQDFVFVSHAEVLDEHWRVLKPGGHLVAYLPHSDFGAPGAMRPVDLIGAMRPRTGWQLILDEVRSEATEHSFLQVYRKRADTLQSIELYDRPKKAACVVRYGGFGDMIQTANVLPGLKRQGFHVTVMTTPKGRDILEHDPHVDEWIVQDDGQVPNEELRGYWHQWSMAFERFVNLSESVEGTLLAIPGRTNHSWPKSVRNRYLNVNYLEFCNELAEVAYRSDAKFYPSEDEKHWRDEYMAEHFAGAFPIMWTLAGSSLHKFYPWQDSVIAKAMLRLPQAKFVLVGDEACQILEQGWELEPRVITESGRLSIRKTLALAQSMGCVVGPETGVLNAVGFEQDIAKVCLLSHSSKENLTKHWRYCYSIEPNAKVECYPCHRLHYSDQWCPTEETSGAAMCQFSIDPETVFQAIQKAYARWERERRLAA